MLNLDKLWTLVSEQSRLKYANASDGKVPVINIVKAVSEIITVIFFNNSQRKLSGKTLYANLSFQCRKKMKIINFSLSGRENQIHKHCIND